MSKKKDHIRVCRMKTNSQLRLSTSTKQQQKIGEHSMKATNGRDKPRLDME